MSREKNPQFEPLLKSLSLQVDMVRHQLGGVQPLVKDFTDRLMDTPPERETDRDAASSEPSSSVGQARPRSAPSKGGEAAPAKAARPKAAEPRRAPAKKSGEEAP